MGRLEFEPIDELESSTLVLRLFILLLWTSILVFAARTPSDFLLTTYPPYFVFTVGLFLFLVLNIAMQLVDTPRIAIKRSSSQRSHPPRAMIKKVESFDLPKIGLIRMIVPQEDGILVICSSKLFFRELRDITVFFVSPKETHIILRLPDNLPYLVARCRENLYITPTGSSETSKGSVSSRYVFAISQGKVKWNKPLDTYTQDLPKDISCVPNGTHDIILLRTDGEPVFLDESGAPITPPLPITPEGMSLREVRKLFSVGGKIFLQFDKFDGERLSYFLWDGNEELKIPKFMYHNRLDLTFRGKYTLGLDSTGIKPMSVNRLKVHLDRKKEFELYCFDTLQIASGPCVVLGLFEPLLTDRLAPLMFLLPWRNQSLAFLDTDSMQIARVPYRIRDKSFASAWRGEDLFVASGYHIDVFQYSAESTS